MGQQCTVCETEVTEATESCPQCGSKLNFSLDIEIVETMIQETPPAPIDKTFVVDQKKITKNNAPKPGDSLLNLSIGGCTLKKQIGRGGMGCVYLAHHNILDKPVAVKILHKEFARQNLDAVERFLKEARSIARLNHPNIVSAFNAGMEHDLYFMVMELVEGENLNEILSRPYAQTLKETLEVLLQVCQALQHAHDNGIIHRDIKPENIFIDKQNNAKVGDLGLAKDLNEEQGMTTTTSSMGTPYYISPEQATSAKYVDHRTDIYSLGCTIFRIFCGQVPYPGKNSFDTVHKHLTEAIPDPRRDNKNLPIALSDMIQKMMAKKPEERYQKMSDISKLIQGLLNNLNQKELNSPVNAVPYKAKKEISFHKKILSIVVITIALAVTLAVLMKDPVSTTTNRDAGPINQLLNSAKSAEHAGQYMEARNFYKDAIKKNPDFIDIHLAYSALLKQQEGIEGARAEYNLLADTMDSPSIHLNKFLLMRTKEKAKNIEKLTKEFPNYGPLFYFSTLSWQIDPTNQTFAEKLIELKLLRRFKTLNEEGKFLKFFINKTKAEGFKNFALERLKALELQAPQLNSPVTLAVASRQAPENPTVIFGASKYKSSTLYIMINTYEPQHIKDIFYRISDKGDFIKLGRNPGNPNLPNQTFTLKSQEKPMNIYIKYIDKKGMTNGPHKIVFNSKIEEIAASKRILQMTASSWIHFQKYDGKLNIHFSTIIAYAKDIKSIMYSLESNSLNKELVIDPINHFSNSYLNIPRKTKNVFVQITFKDDSKSKIRKFENPHN
ncbi:MAG: protein kinase [Lentisphaeraceae bacterium]|nr:protein kinase [Lentisphaeraceae bacterium]